jgi:hypothetical protein
VLLKNCVTHCPDFKTAKLISIKYTTNYRKVVQSLTGKLKAQNKYLVGLGILAEIQDKYGNVGHGITYTPSTDNDTTKAAHAKGHVEVSSTFLD